MGIIVEDEYGKRYAVQFQAYSSEHNLSNLYGLLDEPFSGKGESLERLINVGDYIGVEVSRSENPIRSAYRLNYVLKRPMPRIVKPASPFGRMYNHAYKPYNQYL